jgi:hypothetical protein
MGITSGRIYVMECQGGIPGSRWLNGQTKSYSVNLAPDTTDEYSGTKWLALNTSAGWRFQCQGSLSTSLYLNGQTKVAQVNLDANAGDSGTLWSLTPVANPYGNADYVVTCLGTVPGNTILNGETKSGAVDLAPNSGPDYSGTRWRFYELAIY